MCTGGELTDTDTVGKAMEVSLARAQPAATAEGTKEGIQVVQIQRQLGAHTVQEALAVTQSTEVERTPAALKVERTPAALKMERTPEAAPSERGLLDTVLEVEEAKAEAGAVEDEVSFARTGMWCLEGAV